jgi:hypothetical protein
VIAKLLRRLRWWIANVVLAAEVADAAKAFAGAEVAALGAALAGLFVEHGMTVHRHLALSRQEWRDLPTVGLPA